MTFNDGLANIVEPHLHKGSRLYIKGSLKTRDWTDQRTEKRIITAVVLQPINGKLIMLDGSNARDTLDARSSSPSIDNGLDDEIPL